MSKNKRTYVLKRPLLCPFVGEFVARKLLAGECKYVVADVAAVEIADLDGRPEERNLDFQAHRRVGSSVDEGLHMLDIARDTVLGVERHLVILLLSPDMIGVVVGMEGELTGILVAVRRVRVMQFDGLFLRVHLVETAPVAPGSIAFLDELLLLALIPDRSCRLVEAYDVDMIAERATLRAEHHGISLVENAARLCLVGRQSRSGRQADRQQCRQ